MKKLYILFLLVSFIAKSQGILKGNVYYQNSGSEPAEGVLVSATDSNGDYSKTDGAFTLAFEQSGAGETVYPKIGKPNGNNITTDAKGKEIELVNEKELEYVTIPKNPSENPIKIIVCPRGSRDLAAQKYYKIIKTSADKELDKIKKDLNNLIEENTKDYQRIAKQSKKIVELEKQNDSLAMYKEAYFLASINKDDALVSTLEYLNCIENGGSISDCREILNIEKLKKTGKKSIITLNSTIEALETRMSASFSIFDYEDSYLTISEIIGLLVKADKNPLTIAPYYSLGSNFLRLMGRYQEALQLAKNSLIIREKYIDKNSNLIDSYLSLASAYSSLGQLNDALLYDLKAVETLEKNSSTSISKQLSNAYNNLAMTYNDLSEFDMAIKYHKKSINIEEMIFEPMDFRFVSSYSNIVVVYEAKGQYHLALDYAQKAVKIAENENKESPGLATAYNNLALILGSLGKYNEAIDLYEKSLIIKEKLYNNHPDIGLSYANLGSQYSNLGNYRKAVEYHKKAIEIQESFLGDNHMNLAITYGNLATDLNLLGKFQEALEFANKAHSINLESLESNHLQLAQSYAAIGQVQFSLSNYEKALENFEHSFKIRQKKLDSNHLELAASYDNLAQIYNKLGLYDKAQESLKEAINIKVGIDTNHPDLSLSYGHLINIYINLKDHKNALIYGRKALDISIEKYGLNSPHTATNLNNIGNTYYNSRSYEEAMAYFERAIMILNDLEYLEHPDLATFYNNSGYNYYALGQYENSIDHYLKSLKIKEKIFGLESSSLASLLVDIASTYVAMENYKEALKYYTKIRDFQDYFVVNNGMGYCHYQLKNYEKAIDFYKTAANISNEYKISEFYYNNLGMAYAKNKQFKKAKIAFDKLENLYPNNGKTFRNWGTFYALKNEKDKAFHNLEKAIELGYNDVEWFNTDDSLDGLREDERFRKLIESIINNQSDE